MVTDVASAVEHYMALPYRIELIPDEGGWFVSMPDLPGCMSQGETPGEALEMIRDAQRAWLTAALKHGDTIPKPRAEHAYSGKFVVRLPRWLHRALSEDAEREGVSLNQYLVAALAQRHAQVRVERRLAALEAELRTLAEAIQNQVAYRAALWVEHQFKLVEKPRSTAGFPSVRESLWQLAKNGPERQQAPNVMEPILSQIVAG